MGCCSSKPRIEMKDFQELITVVDTCSVDLARSLDSVHRVAGEFLSLLEEKEAYLRDTSCSNVERLYQKLISIYGTAVKLLVAIEVGKEKKERVVDQVNKDLRSITRRLERKFNKKFPELASDSYVREEEVITTSNSQIDRACKIRNDSIRSMDLHLKVQNLEKEILDMKEMIRTAQLEKESVKELKKVEALKEQSAVQFRKPVNEKGIEIGFAGHSTDFLQTRNDEVAELRLANDQLKLERDQLKSEREKHKNEIELYKRNIEKLQQDFVVVRNQLKRKEDDFVRLNEELAREKSTSIKKDHLTTEMQRHIANLENEKQILQEDWRKLSQNAEEKIKELEHSNAILKQENEAMKQELETLKSRKSLQVQLYSQNRGGLSMAIEEELESLLKSRMENTNSDVDFVKCMSTNHIQTDKPLLLLCINASRLGTDVSNILQGIHVTSTMALLIFHHKDVHALPNQASDRVLSGPQFKGLGGIYDLAFLSGKGIYSCEMNSYNVTNVINFIASCFTKPDTNV